MISQSGTLILLLNHNYKTIITAPVNSFFNLNLFTQKELHRGFPFFLNLKK